MTLLLLLATIATAENLMDCKVLESRFIGRGASTSPNFERFSAMVKNQDTDGLKKLAKGSPAARLYGALGLYQIDKKSGRKALKALVADQSEVTVMQGCVIQQSTISDVAEQLLDGNRKSFSLSAFKVD